MEKEAYRIIGKRALRGWWFGADESSSSRFLSFLSPSRPSTASFSAFLVSAPRSHHSIFEELPNSSYLPSTKTKKADLLSSSPSLLPSLSPFPPSPCLPDPPRNDPAYPLAIYMERGLFGVQARFSVSFEGKKDRKQGLFLGFTSTPSFLSFLLAARAASLT